MCPKKMLYVGGLAALLAGCQSDKADPAPRAPADAVPTSVAVAGSSVAVGTKLGSQSKKTTVAGFRVSRSPTTVAQFRQCVAAGVCSEPNLNLGGCSTSQGLDGPTYDLKQGDSLPVTCTLPAQAAAYCRWVGGRLPTLEEWLLAARGSTIRRFAWGDSSPDCEKHWRRSFSRGARCPDLDDGLGLGTRSAGASPSGVQDVLATRGELVAKSLKTSIPGCRAREGACVVGGLVPGAIDFFLPLPEEAAPGTQMLPASGFRCVWESE